MFLLPMYAYIGIIMFFFVLYKNLYPCYAIFLNEFPHKNRTPRYTSQYYYDNINIHRIE